METWPYGVVEAPALPDARIFDLIHSGRVWSGRPGNARGEKAYVIAAQRVTLIVVVVTASVGPGGIDPPYVPVTWMVTVCWPGVSGTIATQP